MAQITGAQNERVFQIKKWLGLNQNPDGDTKLKMGEAAIMRNWRVTRDGNLQKRPGTREVLHLGENEDEAVLAVWTGFVAEEEAIWAIVGEIDGTGRLYRCEVGQPWTAELIGSFAGTVSAFPHMFGFGAKLYILTGERYYECDGTTLQEVEGYVPLVAMTIGPEGSTSGGELLEQVNKLTGARRAWLSPNGTGTVFHLPDSYPIQAVDYVKDLGTDEALDPSTYTADLTARTVTFQTAPAEGTNSLEVGWHVAETFRADVQAMTRSEIYNGGQDTRVFLYGDGTARAIYSDLDYSGTPRADYFPDLNVVRVGTSNTPITGLVRQYSSLVAFKPNETWSISFGQVETAVGDLIPGFYTVPVNKSIGHFSWQADVQLVLNDPVTICGSDLYEWVPNRAGNLTRDERQAKRISDRVYETLRQFDFADAENKGVGLRYCRTFDDNYHQEFYLFTDEDKALVWNYAADAWYYYEGLRLYVPFSFHGEMYNAVGGGIQHISTDYHYDRFAGEEPQAIDCYWESGSMSFGADYQRKYSAMLWIGIKPESRAKVTVTVETDRNGSNQEKDVVSALFGFDEMDFSDFTFETNRKPQIKRLKLKAKKFVYYTLILKSVNENAGATIVGADIRVRYTGYAK